MIGATGIWSEEEQPAHIFSYNVARWVVKNTKGMVLDFGAGVGEYSQYFKDMRIPNVSIDGFECKQIDIVKDLTIDFDLVFKGNVLCLEVFEHIPKQYESLFVDNIVRHCDSKLIISVAHEGQQGLGHVNCRPDWYVKELFEGKGFKFEKELTESIRKQPEGCVAYLKENLFVFTKI
jgi:2-polyprenyl-3-methyl-5-hydroxy-6-metoxy-1,4-benzoquinol methylase